jgi:homopolymeric O-antigen transport system ATP-binding protein
MSDTVIHVEGLGKRYRVGERERYLALRDVITRVFSSPFKRKEKRSRDFLWALRDVSLDVAQGEVVGLIGRNGAGKTTLLKLLSRITRPTTGFAEIRGRVGSLLEVGTGFHPELTGRENIYLSGAILGMSRGEINRKFEAIVDFSGVERFIDTSLKHYSSGMQMRLAFAVAAHLEPDILLVDEVLAVGDLEFQKKCLGKMQDISDSGRTIIFISHQMNQIRRLCQRVIRMESGCVVHSGRAAEVIGKYESDLARHETDDGRSTAENYSSRFLRWAIVSPKCESEHILDSQGPLEIRFDLHVRRSVQAGHHGIALLSPENQLLWGTAVDNLELQPGDYALEYRLPFLPLRPGVYQWWVTLWDEGALVDSWHSKPEMIVATQPVTHAKDEWAGILNIPYEFKLNAAIGANAGKR